jgi:bifunctional NMN adenylyltransferase/nudix hydrolase
MTSLGVIVGRFQVPELHKGHLELINFVMRRNAQCLILLGVNPLSASENDPLDYVMREKMLKTYFPSLTVVPLVDMAHDNDLWSKTVDNIVSVFAQYKKVTLYGGRDSFIPYYNGKYKVHELANFATTSGTDVRKKTANTIVNSPEFRAGVIYATLNMKKGGG